MQRSCRVVSARLISVTVAKVYRHCAIFLSDMLALQHLFACVFACMCISARTSLLSCSNLVSHGCGHVLRDACGGRASVSLAVSLSARLPVDSQQHGGRPR